MKAVLDWSRLSVLGEEGRAVIDRSVPLPESVHFVQHSTAKSSSTDVGCAAIPAILFVVMAVTMLVAALLNPQESTNPFWLDNIAIGIPIALAGLTVGNLISVVSRRRRLLDGQDPDGIYLFPDALVQRMNDHVRVLPRAAIQRITIESRTELVGEKRRREVKIEEAFVHIYLDGQKDRLGLGSGSATASELADACRSWHRS